MAKGSRKKVSAAEIALLADAAARRRLDGKTAVLPVGSMEQHGAHLRVSTDTEIAAAISRRVCELGRYALLPPLSYGASFEHAPRLNISVRGATLRALVKDIAASLADARARRLLIINGHYGNQKHLARLPARVSGHVSKRSLKCVVVPYWQFMSDPFDHAGHIETSLMLACSSAEMGAARKGFVEPDSTTVSQHRDLARRASKSFTSVAKNGVWGDPRSATSKEGRRLLDSISANIVDHIT